MSDRPKEFLLKTTFDCDIKTHESLLVIEFDGLTGGFSNEGKYFIKSTPENDPYRKLKMDTKLKACSAFHIPAIVVSYQECAVINESEHMIIILDVIIADAIEKKTMNRLIQSK